MALRPSERFRIFQRDNFTCQYCGRRAPDVQLHVDHAQPQSNGGSDESSNLLTACQDCNLAKAANLSNETRIQALYTATTRQFGPFYGEEPEFILREIEFAVVCGECNFEYMLNAVARYENVRAFLDEITGREHWYDYNDPDKGDGFGDYDYPDRITDWKFILAPLPQ